MSLSITLARDSQACSCSRNFNPTELKINRDLIQDVHKSGPRREPLFMPLSNAVLRLKVGYPAVGVEKAEEGGCGWVADGITEFETLFASPIFTASPPWHGLRKTEL